MRIEEILDRYTLDEQVKTSLLEALTERENGIGDILRLAGAQFGMYPEIVAEILAEAGLGSPSPEAERAMIRSQFIALMERLRTEYEQQHPDADNN